MSLFFVNCERTILFSVKRDLDPPLYHPLRRQQGKERRVLSYINTSCNEPSNTETLQKEIDDLREKLRTETIEVNQLSDLVKNLQLQNKTSVSAETVCARE